MSMATIIDARGSRFPACDPLHTPPLGLRERVPAGLTLMLLVLAISFLVFAPLSLLVAPAWLVCWLLWWFCAGRQRAALDMAASGCCASCQYALCGLPIGADGCTTCPECGAAWRVDA